MKATTPPWHFDIGATKYNREATKFRVWAPFCKSVDLLFPKEGCLPLPMDRDENGYFETFVKSKDCPSDYLFLLDGKKKRPDPASRWQPEGVHSASRILDPEDYIWEDSHWQGLDLKDYILYELHVGTFTEEGTFSAAAEKIPYLIDMGITAVELMPVAQFPGSRNWGYDGVYPYAVQSSYGGPNELKQFVNACHNKGLAVVLDVVYNHLGPEGNYLGDFGPYFTSRYKTPWGEAINFDGEYSDEVRKYFIGNALYWQRQYHIDALRLDAIHAIFDFSASPFLAELKAHFYKQSDLLGRKSWIIAESDLNDAKVINSPSIGGFGIDAQWNDDFHHCVRSFLTKKSNSYFADFGTLEDIAKALKEGFVNDGRWSPFRKRRYGSSSKQNGGCQFVICLQNHDQIANASSGRRLKSLVSLEQHKLAASLLFFAPNLPLLFMGQEWDEERPFLYFTSHGDQELIEAVRKGYRQECERYGFSAGFKDPQDPQTFFECKLNWQSQTKTPFKEVYHFYKSLIALRKQHSSLSNCSKEQIEVTFDEKKQWLFAERKDVSGETTRLFCNFSSHTNTVPINSFGRDWTLLIHSAEKAFLGPGVNKERETDLCKLPPWSACIFLKNAF